MGAGPLRSGSQLRAGAQVTRKPLAGSPLVLAVCLLTALVSLIPIGFSGAEAGFVAHLALAPIFAGLIAEPARIGPLGAFATGLVVDVATLTPLGVCAAAYLAFHGIACRERDFLREVPGLIKWLFFALMAGLVAVVHIAAMAVVAGFEPFRLEVGLSLAVSCLSYPLLSGLAGLARRPQSGLRRRPGS